MKKLLLILLVASPAYAGTHYDGFRTVPTDSVSVIAEPIAQRPPYGEWYINPQFNARMIRIGGNSGSSFTFTKDGTKGTWGEDARHHYSKDQPWSINDRWFIMEHGGASANPSGELILDAFNDYKPYKPLDCPGLLSLWEQRWDVRPNHGKEVWGIANDDGTLMTHGRLIRRDVIDCVDKQSFDFSDSLGKLDIEGGGIGWGEGNFSMSGRFVAIGKWNGTQLRVQIFDADSNRAGPVNVIPDNGMSNKKASEWMLSPSGAYMVVHYSGSGRQEASRVFMVDTLGFGFGHLQPAHYVCKNYGTGNTGENIGIYNRVAAYSTASTDTVKGDTTGYYTTPKNGGWISSGSHPDLTWDPDSLVDNMVYLPRGWGSFSHTEIAAVNLATGVSRSVMKETPAGAGDKIAAPEHVSARSSGRLGWVYISFTQDSTAQGDGATPTRIFRDEVLAVKINGNPNAPTIQRIAHFHATHHRDQATWPGEKNNCVDPENFCYRNEPHAVFRWDGKVGVFASNWKRSCIFGCGPSVQERTDYVIDLACRPPNSVVDFVATAPDTATIALTWTMPGADTTSWGQPRKVEIRYATVPLSEANFATEGTALSPQPTITSYGKEAGASIRSLATNTAYYIAMKVTSECGLETPLVTICQATRTTGGGEPTACENVGRIARGNKPPAPCDGCPPTLGTAGGSPCDGCVQKVPLD